MRKFLLMLLLLVCGTAFGVFAMMREVDLVGAAAFWTAVSAGPAFGFMQARLKDVQVAKANGNGSAE